jgi:hypothetical protein
MEGFRDKYEIADHSVVDVGSLDINGSYRELFTNYTGLDIVAGKNVDVVAPGKYDYGEEKYDVVISGQTMEHVEDIYAHVDALAKISKDLVCIIVPTYGWREHRHPVDCWRVFPDGLKFLLKRSGLEVLECETHYALHQGVRIGETIAVARVK